MKKQFFAIAMIFTLVIGMLPTVPLPNSLAAPYVRTINVNFGVSPVNGKSYLPTSQMNNYSVDISYNGQVIDYWEVSIGGGSFKKNVGTLNGSNLKLPTINGSPVKVYNKQPQNPGHMLTRSVDGKKWITAATDPDSGAFGSYTFDGSCLDSQGVSDCPGLIPLAAPSWLRDSSGRAMTYSKNIAPPTKFYFNEKDIQKGSGPQIPANQIDPDTFEILPPPKSEAITGGVQFLQAGIGKSGKGMIKVSKTLNGSQSIEGIDYRVETFTNPQGKNQLRNYYMDVNMFWQATTYEFPSVQVRVTYKDTGGTPPPDPTPGSSSITGDFDILPSTINYRDPFKLHPKNIVLKECTYQYHEYKFVNDTTMYSSLIHSKDQDTSYTYSTYPMNLTAGTIDVYIKVVGDCGDSGWVGPKPLVVKSPPDNDPPVFEAGFFKSNDYNSWEPEYQAVYDSYLNLRIIDTDPLADPEEPYDPDGDPITYTWDFTGSSDPWIQKIGEDEGGYNHEERYTFIKADSLGHHSVKVTATDSFGASTTHTVSINIVPPNPVPVISGPDEVVEGRPLPEPFDGSRSYSPADNKIVQYLWDNKKDKYMTPGTEIIKLDVVDDHGLKSLAPATHTLTVKPDLPPIAQLLYSSKGIRNVKMTFQDTSYSPDGDIIVEHSVYILCDKNNNGTYTDDSALNVTPDEDGYFDLTPTQVANCKVHIHLKEDWGKSDDKDFDFQVLNQQPNVLTSITGQNPLPSEMQTEVYKMLDLITNKGRFRVEDFYEASRAPGFYYDAKEQALAAPHRDFSIYSVPTNGSLNVSPTGYDLDYWVWGYTNALLDYYPMGDRFNKSIWYSWDTSADCDGACLPFGYSFTTYNAQTGVTYTMEENGGKWTYYYKVNKQLDMLWLRKVQNHDTCPWSSSHSYRICTGTTMYDLQYKVSDIAIGKFTPVQQTTMVWQNYYAEDNLPPSWWVEPNSTLVKPADNVPWNFDDGETKKLDARVITPTKDKNGNFYALECSSSQVQMGRDDDGDPVYRKVYQCYLEKVSPTGTVLWKNTSKTYTNYIVNYAYRNIPYLDIAYISEDNATLVTTDGIYDNNTGSYIGQLPDQDNSGYQGVPNSNYPQGYGTFAPLKKAYNDKIFYQYTTQIKVGEDSHDRNIYEYTTYNIIYDFKTRKVILNEIEEQTTSKSNYRLATDNAITSDGKLLIARRGSYNKLHPDGYHYTFHFLRMKLYDMVTGNKLFEQEVEDPIVYNNDSSITLHLTGDREGFIEYDYEKSSDSETRFTSIRKFTFTGTVEAGGKFSYGNILDKTQSFSDGTLSLKIKYADATYSDQNGAGLTFREQDNRNYYQAELTTGSVVLNKVVNGELTQLEKQGYPTKIGTYVNLKVKAFKNHIIVYVNGVPLIDQYDSQFSSGLAGVFANAPNVYLKEFSAETTLNKSTMIDNIAIVNAPIQYSIVISDPENDPAITQLGKWTYSNMKPDKFLDAGDGNSDTPSSNTYNGLITNPPLSSIGKVGLFDITFTEPDDPAPNGYKYPNTTFASFQKYADPDEKFVVVHRAPISIYSLHAAEDGTVIWNDTSYDPDRWLSPTKYSTEDTGLDYKTTRGIVERKYYFITPDGDTVNQKLVAPQVIGTYTVAMAVKDEYGAWSDWNIQTINITQITPPNTPPVAGFTLSRTTTYPGTPVTITSAAHDLEDGVAANLQHEYYIRSITNGGPEGFQSNSRGSWNKTFNTLGTFEIRQVVTDSKGQSDQVIKRVTVINRSPIADFDWTPKPVWEGDRIHISNLSSDPDGDSLTYLWKVQTPDSRLLTYTSSNISIPTAQLGTYIVKLTASDGLAQSDIQHTIVVQELKIQANVLHTSKWLSYHQDKGHQTTSHPKDFYSGEIFVVEVDTSPVAVSRVTSWIDTKGLDDRTLKITADLAAQSTPNHYAGELFDERFMSMTEGLPEGLQQIHFRVEYANGVSKEQSIPVNILGNVHEAVGVHRRQ